MLTGSWVQIVGDPASLEFAFGTDKEAFHQYIDFLKRCDEKGIACHRCWWGIKISEDLARVKCWAAGDIIPIPEGECENFILDDRMDAHRGRQL